MIIVFFFRKGKIFIGVRCDTNDAKVAKLLSTISAGKRTYNCSCDGTITIGEATMYCYGLGTSVIRGKTESHLMNRTQEEDNTTMIQKRDEEKFSGLT